jgi:hypothetical protein
MGGLFGGAPAPAVRAPIKDVEEPRKSSAFDPDEDEKRAAAARKKIALKSANNRTNLRTSNITAGGSTRQSISITGDN